MLYTIGHTGKSLRQFIGLLRGAEVDVVVDVRLHNTSQLAGYAKRDDLAFILETFGLAYEHVLDLAPTEEMLKRYRASHDWPGYEAAFRRLLAERSPLASAWALLSRYGRPCLLCSEHSPQRCHRRLVAERLAELHAGVKVEHLV